MNGSNFRYHMIVDSFKDDKAHILDTKTGKVLYRGSIDDCDEYIQSMIEDRNYL